MTYRQIEKKIQTLRNLLTKKGKAHNKIFIRTQPELYNEWVNSYNETAYEIRAYVSARDHALNYDSLPLDKASSATIEIKTTIEYLCTPLKNGRFVIEAGFKYYGISIETEIYTFEKAKTKWERETKSPFPYEV